jgi:hypothetical protein
VRGLKVVSAFAVKAYVRGGLAPPFLNFGVAWSPHAPVALPLWKEFPLPKAVWEFWASDKYIDLTGNRTPDYPTRSPDRYAIPAAIVGTASCEASASLVLEVPIQFVA